MAEPSRAFGVGDPSAFYLAPPRHVHEGARLASVRRFEGIVPTDDPAMTSLAREAADLCGAPLGIVSMMEEDEQRYLGCVGADHRSVPRDVTFCAHTILQDEPLVVEDAQADPRFRHNPFVAGDPFVRFYAGAAILDESGLPVGSLCVVDFAPREFSSKGVLALKRLARLASAALEVRRLFAPPAHLRPLPPELQARQARLDALLLTLVQPHPKGG